MKNIEENKTFDILDDIPRSLSLPICIGGSVILVIGMICPLASVAIIARQESVSLYYAYTLIEETFQNYRRLFTWIWVFGTCFSMLRIFRVQTKTERTKVFYVLLALLFIGLTISIWYFAFPAIISILSAA